MALEPIVVIGGGAAGLLCAGRAAELGARVILVEKNLTLGRKIFISGKGRCNVTNTGEIRDFIENYPEQGQFLYSAFHRFFNQDLQKMLESFGVTLKVERGGRVFPASDKSSDIIKALTRYLDKGRVDVRLGETVQELLVSGNQAVGVRTERGSIAASRVIVCTGGMSYPATGSTGDGYNWARQLRHTVTPLRPALVPLNIREEWVTELQGIALKNVEATLQVEDKIYAREFGEMLFTHFGVSGPIILTISRWVVDAQQKKFKLYINLKPALSRETLDCRLQRDFAKYARKQLKNALDELLPKALIPFIIKLSEIPSEKFVHQITKEERERLVGVLTALPLTVTGPRPIAEAIVTAGGVTLKEVYPKTMESKIVSCLYFAGEVLDIDGYTGGYNLQAAFSTGYAAGEAAADGWS